jgi:hypothetical protein
MNPLSRIISVVYSTLLDSVHFMALPLPAVKRLPVDIFI